MYHLIGAFPDTRRKYSSAHPYLYPATQLNLLPTHFPAQSRSDRVSEQQNYRKIYRYPWPWPSNSTKCFFSLSPKDWLNDSSHSVRILKIDNELEALFWRMPWLTGKQQEFIWSYHMGQCKLGYDTCINISLDIWILHDMNPITRESLHW